MMTGQRVAKNKKAHAEPWADALDSNSEGMVNGERSLESTDEERAAMRGTEKGSEHGSGAAVDPRPARDAEPNAEHAEVESPEKKSASQMVCQDVGF